MYIAFAVPNAAIARPPIVGPTTRAERSMPKYAAFALVSSSGSTSAGTTLKSVVTPHATSTVPSRNPMR